MTAPRPLFVDSHPTLKLQSPIEHFYGWAALAAPAGEVKAYCDGHDLRMARVQRPDVVRAGHANYFGFAFFLDLPGLVGDHGITSETLDIEFRGDGDVVASFGVEVDRSLVDGARYIHANRSKKADFIADHLKVAADRIEGCVAPSALPAGWSLSPRLDEMTDAVSSHAYGPAVTAFLKGLAPNAWVLDAGAGLRRWPTRNVVNMEIYDYPSTDILAIGQSLPFKDDSFDAALSLAVLEHVDDPFLCASELMRVVKPGGKIMVIIPFLQSEHGYPSHFFNATRFGVRKLFEKGASLERQFLDFSNHPVFTLHQILGQYAAGLQGELREAFLNAPIRTFVDNHPTKMSVDGNPFVRELSDEMRWILAAGTTSIFVKG